MRLQLKALASPQPGTTEAAGLDEQSYAVIRLGKLADEAARTMSGTITNTRADYARRIDEMVPIEGQLELVVTDVGEVAPGSSASPVCADLGIGAGETVFCVVLTDAAGNTGPGDCTPSLTID